MSKRKLLFVGPVLTASGYGVHARQLLRALVDCGQFEVVAENIRWGETSFIQGEPSEWVRELCSRTLANPEVCVQVTIPNEFKRRAPLTIGVTAGIEVDHVSPAWLMKCNAEVDLVVVPSRHSYEGFRTQYDSTDGKHHLVLEKPIFVSPEGVDTSVYRPAPARSPLLDDIGVPEKNFVCTGLGLDKPRGRDRKNITSLVEWFCKSFAGDKGVGLILKTSIVNGSTVDFELTKKRIAEIKASTGCGEYPKIFVVHGRLEDERLAEIYNDPRVISMVSLTHGEGYGLPMIEAAACGLPVMATDWSGHLDFLTKDGRKLFVPIAYDLQEVFPEVVWDGVIEPGTKWAIPREQDAVTKMRKMVTSSVTPRKWAAELAAHIADNYRVEKTNEALAALVSQAAVEMAARNPSSREDFAKTIRERVKQQGKSLLYTMPMSAGDVFLSTGIVSALRERHPGHRVYFATSPQYFDIVRNVADGGSLLIEEVIEWQPWMQDVSLLEDIFDEVYTPNLAVQMTWSNWIHRGRGRNLIDEFAAQCNVAAKHPLLPPAPSSSAAVDATLRLNAQEKRVVAVHAGGQKSARAWAHWTELVKNVRASGDLIVQVGASDDIGVGEVDLDLRGKTSFQDLPTVLSLCGALVCIDSYPMHVAGALGIDVVAIFGSSYPTTTGPRFHKSLAVIETEDRNGCERACYKDTCKVDAGNPCINHVRPKEVFFALGCQGEYREHRPRISGYTHVLRPKAHGYPYVQSIKSMLGFCDEVVVVNGDPSDPDESMDDLRDECVLQIASGQLKIIDREWDPEEPGMDGMQKAFGRAMCSPESEFLWQQDADEVVHEDDYGKIVDICKRFPSDVGVVHLPVVELWGDDRTCRTDRHSWKWRLSRNDFSITHGINDQARLMDPKTGRIYSKPGMSDGCEYIDIATGKMLPHRGFYSGEIEKARREDYVEYGRMMNQIFSQLPSVWHYSWADLPRKVRNFRDFWDNQWQVLYQAPPTPRFPDVVTDEDVGRKAEELRKQGGEHGAAPTFKLEKSAPRIMEGWNE